MNSRNDKTNNTLAKLSEREAKRFLTELANLQQDTASFKRLFNHFSSMLSKLLETALSSQDAFSEAIKLGLRLELWEFNVLCLRDAIRQFWRESDHRTREYQAFLLQKQALEHEYGRSFDGANPLPAPSQLEQAFIYLRKLGAYAIYCKNPDCPAPYFFSSRRNQKFCSDACAIPAQREFKRQWWAEHGEEWRATRKNADKGGKPKKQKGRK